jgi:hypothetical protein
MRRSDGRSWPDQRERKRQPPGERQSNGGDYDGIMSWHARTSYIYDDRPVIPIDLRRDDEPGGARDS